MSFLALVLAWLLLRFWPSSKALHRDDWFHRFSDWVAKLPLPDWLQCLVSVLLPVALVHCFLQWLLPGFLGLQWIVAAAAVLLYSFDRGDFEQQVSRYRAYCTAGDYEGAYLYFSTRYDFSLAEDADDKVIRDKIQQCLVYEGFQHVFAPMFYFVLLGPAAALAYRLLQLSRGGQFGNCSDKALFCLDWLPARLMCLMFTLAGDFVRSRDRAVGAIFSFDQPAPELLQSVALASIAEEPAGDSSDTEAVNAQVLRVNAELHALLSRSVLGVVGLLALWVLVY